MWNYPDLNNRLTVRTAVYRDPEWLAFMPKSAPMLLEMQSVLLLPTPFSTLR